VILARELRARRAGFAEESENTDEDEEGTPCSDFGSCGGNRKVLEWENVGFGVTGPMERRDAAKWGSRASRSIASDRNDDGCLFGKPPGLAVPSGAAVAGELFGGDSEGFLGYCRRATALADERTSLEVDDPIGVYSFCPSPPCFFSFF